jgi:hypothetical protein
MLYTKRHTSGVLAASMSRSRQKWVQGAVFEKFWSKPKITKGMTDEEKKAAKGPAFTKIGAAKLVAEPHIFDIILHAVKDPSAAPKQGQLPPGTAFLQQFSNQNRSQSPATTPYRPPHGAYQNSTPSQRPPAHAPPPPSTPSSAYSAPRSTPTSHPQQHPPPPPRPIANGQGKGVGSGPPPVPPPTAPDPVIHALAQRASTDMELKSVMKIVATGKASQQQLEYFQKHIDELTKEVKQRQEAEAKQKRLAAAQAAAQPRPTPVAPHATPHSVQPPPTAYQSPRPAQGYAHTPPVSTPRPRPAVASPLHVVVQFSENSTDRFLFPKHCIMEYLPGVTSALCSFIVVRKGSDAADPSRYDPKLEYWEPVTVQITGDAQMLMTLGRYVTSADEARAHMEEVMGRCTRAEDVHLALRLPRDKGGGEEVVA